MSQRARLLIALIATGVAVVSFVIVRPGDDESPGTATTTTAATTTTGGATTTTPPATAPSGPVIRVKGGAPVGGVRAITVRKGEVIRFTVTSDAPEEVHLHGYDVARDVAPGEPAVFRVPATITGVFEVELEHAGTQIARLTVGP